MSLEGVLAFGTSGKLFRRSWLPLQENVIASILMKRLAHCSCYGTVIDWTVIINPAATKYVDNFQSHLRFDAAATAKELEKQNKYDNLTRKVHEGKFLPFAIEATMTRRISAASRRNCAHGRGIPFQQLQARICSLITKFNQDGFTPSKANQIYFIVNGDISGYSRSCLDD